MTSRLESLPAEIFAHIVAHVRGSLASLAASSRQFQAYVEDVTFKRLMLEHTDLADFARMFNRNRLRSLRNVSVDMVSLCLPLVDAVVPSTRVAQGVIDACSESFTVAVRDFLVALGHGGEREALDEHPGIELGLATPSRLENGDCEHDEVYVADGTVPPDEPTRFDKAWLRLLPDLFPRGLVVPAVTSFDDVAITYGRRWGVWPASWLKVLKCLPNVVNLQLHLKDVERKRMSSRKPARDAFGRSLRDYPRALRELTLTYTSRPPENETFAPPDLRDATLGYDIFSYELALLTRRLVKLRLDHATLDVVHFFRVLALEECPALEEIMFSSLQAASADGSWYFVLQPGSRRPSINEDEPTFADQQEWVGVDGAPAEMDYPCLPFRAMMDEDKFKEVYLAVAAAVMAMPRLRGLEVQFEDAYGRYWPFEYRWSPADIVVEWYFPSNMEIGKEIREAWAEVGRKKGASVRLVKDENDDDFYLYNVECSKTVVELYRSTTGFVDLGGA